MRGGAGTAAVMLGTLAWAQDDIRDIRGPKTVPVWPWVLTGVLAAAILGAIYAIRRRRGTPRPLTLSERTLERLERARPLMRPGTAREFGIAASEVIRDYIEQRFDVRATQRTTEEFLQTLLQGSNATLVQHRALLAQFLDRCDFVKFAGDSLSANDLEALFASARDFVLRSAEPARA